MIELSTPAVVYRDPWAMSFSDRVRAFLKGDRRIAYLYDEPDNSTFRYRVYNMIQALELGDGSVSASFFRASEYDRIGYLIDQAEAVVICRCRYAAPLAGLVMRARRKGKKVLFDVDDLVIDAHRIPLIMDTLNANGRDPATLDWWYAYVGRLQATLRQCDAAITTNPHLAGLIEEVSGNPCSVIPNFMNREQLEISINLFEEKRAEGFDQGDCISLGYFSGSPSHKKDFDLVSGTLARLLAGDERLRVSIAGYIELTPALQPYASRVTYIPFQDFINLQRMVAGVDINLMPLQHNLFTNCKSELKYFEAGVVGTVSIASPTYTYERAIRDGENGFLARDHEWDQVIRRALAMMDEPGGYARMATEAQRDSSERFSVDHFEPLVRETVLS
ncbi:MAG: glycosyltransferase [Lautropia sp.]|nr:glycosyltransferase [Lautropia sp.]